MYYGSAQREEEETYCTWNSFITFLIFIFSVFFNALVIYSLAAFDTEAVKNDCPGLYTFMILRTVVGFCIFVSISTYNLAMVYAGAAPLAPTTRLMVYVGLLIYFAVFAMAGGVVVSRSMIGNSMCTDAIYDSNFQAPLLGDLGWTYVILDTVLGLCILLLITMTRDSSQSLQLQPQPQEESYYGD